MLREDLHRTGNGVGEGVENERVKWKVARDCARVDRDLEIQIFVYFHRSSFLSAASTITKLNNIFFPLMYPGYS